MARLLIVEDEEMTRNLLLHYVAWGELGVKEARSARNGLEALALAEEWAPDVVLSDIRMPKMDGIEFVTRLRERFFECQVIFLSGSSDKQYLKSAIHLRATSYIEKPINLEEVRSVIQEAVNAHRQIAYKRQEARELLERVHESVPLLRQELVKEWVKEKPDLAYIRSRFQSPVASLPETGPYTVVAAPVYWRDDELLGERDTVTRELLRVLNEQSEEDAQAMLCGFVRPDLLVIVLSGVHSRTYAENRSRLERLYALLREQLGSAAVTALGVGEPAAEAGLCSAAFRSAEKAAGRFFYEAGARRIFFSGEDGTNEQGEGRRFELPKAGLAQFRAALNQGELDEAVRMTLEWTREAQKIRDLDTARVRSAYFELLLLVLDAAAGFGMIDAADEQEKGLLWKELDRLPTLRELSGHVVRNIDSAFARRHEPDAGSRKVHEAMKYVYANYGDKRLSIQSVAEHVGLSETYLCSLFKKHRKQTIKEYVSALRMEKAKDLLQGPELKLYEVAVSVGFSDPNYFTTFFKRFTGMTPSEYRERVGRS